MLGLFLMGGSDTGCAMLAGGVFACCAMYGLYNCAKCRVRDCTCIKRTLRCFGCDPYSDMDLFVIVHEVQFTSHSKLSTSVRVTAGRQVTATDLDKRGTFHQPLSLFVEQGTEFVLFEMLDGSNTVLAQMKLLVSDVMQDKKEISKKVYAMHQKEKSAVNPRIRLTVRQDMGDPLENSLPFLASLQESSGTGMSTETSLILRDHFQQMKCVEEARPLSELDILSNACSGALKMFGSWGKSEDVWLAVLCPPQRKKYTIGIWSGEDAFQAGRDPKEEIEVLKVLGVSPDAGRSDTFLVNYMTPDKVKERATFARSERPRDTWVEMLGMLITKVREAKDASKDSKKEKKGK